jgi:alkylhydroperoxidase family enzyme
MAEPEYSPSAVGRASRVPPLPADLQAPQPLVSEFRARRDGRLNEADRIVLHAPGFARGWNLMAESIRSDLTLPIRLRKLIICAVGALTGADYQVAKHAPGFLAAGGTQSQLAALAKLEESIAVGSGVFDPVERSALQLALEMTSSAKVKINDATFAAVRQALKTDEAVVEVVGLISFYNMVSRFLVAVEVHE